MIQFNKPENLDGAVLVQELVAAGITIESDARYEFGVKPPRVEDNKLYLAVNESDKSKAEVVIAAHLGGN